MTRIIATALAAALSLALPAFDANAAEDPDEMPVFGSVIAAEDHELDEFLWLARPILVFADTPADPRFQQQLAMIEAELGPLIDRDVIVLTDADPSAANPIRSKLHPRGFQMVLIGKDGAVKLRKPLPYSVREITRTIDKTPLRQQEVRDRRLQRQDEITQ